MIHVDLPFPKEPHNIKDKIVKEIERFEKKGGDFKWNHLAIWCYKRIQSYLWNSWKEYLKPVGFNWQKFLKLMSYHKDDILWWAKSTLLWDELVRKVINTLQGSVGEMIRKS
jgi:hypothetical protein